MNKKLISGLLIIASAVFLQGCCMSHEWKDATCTEPKTCIKCGTTEGAPAGHNWNAATCEAPKTCTVCGITEGDALGHTWADATCTSPKTCSVCGKKEGEPLGHSWVNATCQTPKTCSVCGATEGNVAEHDLNSSGKCKVCNKQVGFALNLSNYSQFLSVSLKAYDSTSPRKIVCTVEPLKNLDFSNVKVTWEYYPYGNINSYKESMRKTSVTEVRSNGYGSTTITSSTMYFHKPKVISISGYVIEK